MMVFMIKTRKIIKFLFRYTLFLYNSLKLLNNICYIILDYSNLSRLIIRSIFTLFNFLI